VPPLLGVSLGDPNGIGLEITLKAFRTVRAEKPDLRLCCIGDRNLVKTEAEKQGMDCPEVLDPGVPFPRANYGQTTAEAGIASAAWVTTGIDACLNQELDALITAPINKHAWDLAGVDMPGHTELLGARCGTDRFGMMLMGKGLRVFLATRHLPLASVPEVLSEKDIRLAVELVSEALPFMGIDQPRIAVCGLNPHAGDGGTLGTEERDWIEPLLNKMQAEGFGCSGPHPADTVFHQALHGHYDAVIALYHDQGLGPLKLLAFDEGVNVTLGLPIIRTSPDHGTAFGIAGKGIARADSMHHAILAAADLTQRHNPWTRPR